MKNIFDWLAINKLSLNVQKTKFMLFHFHQRDISHIVPDLHINNHTLERVSEFNFLGLTIDENFTWNSHIQKISNKVSRALGVMSRLKRFLPSTILRLLYNSLVLPHLQYSILAWGFKNSRLTKLQKRAVRIICGSKYNAHTEPLFKKLNLLRLEDIFKLNVLKFLYKFEQNTLPVYFHGMFSIVSSRHTYFTRGSANLIRHKFKTSGGRNCIRHFVPDIAFKTPSSILDKIYTHSYKGFSHYVKKLMINEYVIDCNTVNCHICQCL